MVFLMDFGNVFLGQLGYIILFARQNIVSPLALRYWPDPIRCIPVASWSGFEKILWSGFRSFCVVFYFCFLYQFSWISPQLFFCFPSLFQMHFKFFSKFKILSIHVNIFQIHVEHFKHMLSILIRIHVEHLSNAHSTLFLYTG